MQWRRYRRSEVKEIYTCISSFNRTDCQTAVSYIMERQTDLIYGVKLLRVLYRLIEKPKLE